MNKQWKWNIIKLSVIINNYQGNNDKNVLPVWYNHRPSSLPVVGDDLPVVIPKHKGGIEIEGTGLNDAGQIDGGAFLDVSLLGSEDGSFRLDDPEEDPVLEVRRGADLTTVPASVARHHGLQHQPPQWGLQVVLDLTLPGISVSCVSFRNI